MRQIFRLFVVALPFFGMALAVVSARQILLNQGDSPLPVSNRVSPGEVGMRRYHSMRLNKNGSIKGRVGNVIHLTTLTDITSTVSLTRDNVTLATTETDVEGRFVLDNLTPGLSTISIQGSNGFTIFGLELLDYDASDADVQMLETGLVTSSHENAKKIIDEQKEFEPEDETDQSNLIVGANRVELKQGRLVGKIWGADKRLADDSTVTLLQNGESLQSTTTNEKGEFGFLDVSPGVHDVVVRGLDGIAAIRVEFVDGEELASLEFVPQSTALPTLEILLARLPAPIQNGFETAPEIVLAQPANVARTVARPVGSRLVPIAILGGLTPLFDDNSQPIVPAPTSPNF